MKKTFIVFVISFLAVSCYDDTAIWDSIRDHETRLAKLETLCAQINTNIASLYDIVGALQKNDYVTGTAPIVQNGKEIGYTITFASGKTVTIYHGNNGAAGSDGNTSATPLIGLKKDTDGLYYWTLDGEWLLDDDGKKVCATVSPEVCTPELKIEDDKWYVSYDGGDTWEYLDKVVSGDPDGGVNGCSFFSDVKINDNSVVLTLSDGSQIVIPKKFAVSFAISELKSTYVVFAGKAKPMSPDYEVGIYYSTDRDVQVQKSHVMSCVDFDEDGSFIIRIGGLKTDTEYFYRTYVSMYGDIEYSDVKTFTTKGGQNEKVVKKITYTMVDYENEVSGWILDYVYDDFMMPVEFTASNFGYKDEIDEDKFIFKIYDEKDGSGTKRMIDHYYHHQLEGRAEVFYDSYGRVSSIVDTGEGKSDGQFEIEYNSDGRHDKVSFEYSESSTYELEFNYSNGYLYSIKDGWLGDDESYSTSVYDESRLVPNRYPSSKLNVDINMLQIFYIPEEPYIAMTHLGLCGEGFTGPYLYEELNTEIFGSNFISFGGDYYGETMDQDYLEHRETFEYAKKEGSVSKLSYEFDSDGCPVRYTASIPVEKYLVEYDLVAGSVISEWYEYIDEEVLVKLYEIVPDNVEKTLVDTVYETFEGKIEYM